MEKQTQRKTKPTSAECCLRRDYMRLKRDPFPYITAEPLPENMLLWHYVLKGPENTPYQGGYYHGTLVFPTKFPFKPPTITMITPNGRFLVDFPICMTMTSYHPDSWNPSWWVGSILTGLLSFMLDNEPAAGMAFSTTKQKRIYARDSIKFNLKSQVFRELFPELCEEMEQVLLQPRPMIVDKPEDNESPSGGVTLLHFLVAILLLIVCFGILLLK